MARETVRQLRKDAFEWVTGDAPESQPDRPWQAGVRSTPPTMLTSQELTLLYWCTSSYYTGKGEIVDAGCFLGGSTGALARGLHDNLRVDAKESRIHSFDLFLVDKTTKPRFFADAPLNPGDSFLERYKEGLGDYAKYVRIYPGDIRKAQWESEIEILFLDVLKLKDINRFALAQFFPRLIPGVSIVIQQDYGHFALPWIHISMARLADYFETLDFRSSSAVFRLKKKIPVEILREGAGAEGPAEEQLALMQKAMDTAPAGVRPIIELAKVMLLSDLLLDSQAAAFLSEIEGRYSESRIVRRIQQVKKYLQKPYRQKRGSAD